MNKQEVGSRPKKAKKLLANKKVLLLLVVILTALGVLFYFYYPKLQPGVKDEQGITQQAKKYDDAVKAWKAGDKKHAQELAKEFLEENETMTQEEREKVPGQANKTLDMIDMVDGLDPL